MPRTTKGAARRRAKKRLFKRTKGYWGARGKLYRVAKQSRMKADQYAYRDRRAKKRDFRRLWITRINAAARINGLSYSTLIAGLKRAHIDVNRKLLADLAVRDAAAFAKLAEVAKSVAA